MLIINQMSLEERINTGLFDVSLCLGKHALSLNLLFIKEGEKCFTAQALYWSTDKRCGASQIIAVISFNLSSLYLNLVFKIIFFHTEAEFIGNNINFFSDVFFPVSAAESNWIQ